MHIFVIEDEQTLREELKILLENALYQVTAPECFEEVVRQVLEAQPDLVLLDVNLPGMSGCPLYAAETTDRGACDLSDGACGSHG